MVLILIAARWRKKPVAHSPLPSQGPTSGRKCYILGGQFRTSILAKAYFALCSKSVIRSVSMALLRPFTACAVQVGVMCALCVLSAVSMALWRLFTGVCALRIVCAKFMASWRSFNGVGALCVVCAVSVALWCSCTASAMFWGGVCALCVVCAVSVAP